MKVATKVDMDIPNRPSSLGGFCKSFIKIPFLDLTTADGNAAVNVTKKPERRGWPRTASMEFDVLGVQNDEFRIRRCVSG